MAAAFIGTAVSVKLKPPRDWVLTGRVVRVENQHLFLENVYFPQSNHHVPEANFSGYEIDDIEVLQDHPSSQTAVQPQVHAQAPQPQYPIHKHIHNHGHNTRRLPFAPASVAPQQRPNLQHQQHQQQPPTIHHPRPQSGLVDPAILSMGRTPPIPALPSAAVASPLPIPQPLQSVVPPANANVSATLTQPFSGAVAFDNRPKDLKVTQSATANKIAAPSALANGSGDEDSAAVAPVGRQSRNRRSKRPKGRAVLQSTNETAAVAPEMTRTGSNAGSGWRQTPLLEEPLKQAELKAKETAEGQNSLVPKLKKDKRHQKLKFEQQNGFASEDATDVQELGDFDFAGNLSKFDKKAVFDQLRIEDTTADEDRLVSHNRIAKPGTFGGQKLLPTENVLDQSHRRLSKELEEDSDVAIADLATSLSSIRMERNASRGSNRQPQRKDSSATRGTSRLAGRSGSQARLNTTHGLESPIRAPSSPSVSVSAGMRRPCLRNSHTNAVCLAMSPFAMKTAEDAAFRQLDGPELGHGGREFNLNADILNENAARNIAEAAINAINPGGRRIGAGNHNAEPVVIVLASENSSGARAVGAARHLLDRGVRVIIAYLEPEEPGPDSEQVNDQLLRFNGKVMQWHQLSAYLKKLDAPPELIIDGLLGIHDTLESIADRRETVLSMMAWANKSKAGVLAVDIPSGVNADSGDVDVVDGEPAEVRAKIVVACGAPSTGLLRAMEMHHVEGRAEAWKLYVCDIGLTPVIRTLIKKKNKDSVGFGNAWMVQLHFDPGADSTANGRSGS